MALRDTRSYETQIIDAVRSVNRALGGTYGTSSAIYKSEFNQYEVQLIDAIKGIGRTLSGKGLSVSGIGGASDESLAALEQRVSALERESFFRLVSGNVTLKTAYNNLWVPGFLSAGGTGTAGGGGGGASALRELEDVYHSDTSVLRANGSNVVAGDALVYNSTLGWVAQAISSGGSTVSVTQVLSSGTRIARITVDGVGTDLYAPSGGGTVTGYIGTTAVQSTSQAQALEGISSVKLSSTSSLFEWDNTNSAWHFYGNLYADGWVSAGGAGSGGGGGGSVVTVTQVLSSGTRIASITVDGVSTDLYAPSGGGGSTVSWGTDGSDYVPLTVNGTTKNLLTTHQSLSNYVTLDTTQTITGAKTFTTNPVTIGSTSGLSVDSSSYIDIGNARIVYDSGAKALHIKNKTGVNDTISLFADGFVSAGGTAAQSTISFVTVEENQTVNGLKTFSGATTFSSRIGVGGATSNSYALNVTGSQNLSGSLTVGSSATISSGLGVGTAWAGSSYKLLVDGSARATAWDTTSDRRLKDDIIGIDGVYAVKTLMALKPSTWTWNCGLAKGTTAAGFIAQDVENIVPYMVSGEDYKSLNYQMLHAFEVSAIQDHETRLRRLEEKIKVTES